MKTSSASAIFFFGATALAAPARYAYLYPYAYPSGSNSGSPNQYSTQTAVYPTGTSAPCPGSGSNSGSYPHSYPYYPYPDSSNSIDYNSVHPTGGVYPTGGSYPTGVYPTGTYYAHASTALPYPTSNPSNPNSNTETTTLLPTLQLQWRKDTPHASGNTPFGEIYRRRNAEDIDTAVQFSVPADLSSKTCKLAFYLPTTSSSSLKYVGNPERRSSFDIYKFADEQIESTDSWASHPMVGDKVATVTPRVGGDAEFQYEGEASFECAQEKYSFVMIPKGEDARVAWKVDAGGAAAGLVLEAY